MTLSAGSRLGPYEILSPLGAGGMGEVYKARDTRLERTVAVKVLPSHMSASAEVRQRFEREAKTISQLSHPHICALYDVGSHEGTEYLVMELLEGETLSARLAKGPLPLEQTLRYGVEIADALDKAHRQGIVHRDLKPGNVMLTKSGVKLLDFGLAKAMAPAQPSGLTSLPTVMGTGQNLTQEGTILGTFQYMAPEQLEGRDADARTDIFAFGCVLYEMATGRKAFSGASQASLISSIMSSEPPSISAVQPMSPPALDRVVKTCLAKDPEDRWQSAGDVAKELKWISEGSAAGVAAPAAVAGRRKSRERLLWIAALLIGAAVSALMARRFLPTTTPPASAVRFDIHPPAGGAFLSSCWLSPDGQAVAFVAAAASGQTRIWVRSLSAVEAQPVDGAGDASDLVSLTWSPDGRSLAFGAERKIKRIALSGGVAEPVCESSNIFGLSWSASNVLAFVPFYGAAVFQVPASGGTPTAVTSVDRAAGEVAHLWPHFLPDGRRFLFLIRTKAGKESRQGWIAAASLDTKQVRRIRPADAFVGVSEGRLLFSVAGTLYAQPFDAKTLQLRGEPSVLPMRAVQNGSVVSLLADVAGANLVFRSDPPRLRQLVFVDRTGHRISEVGKPEPSLMVTISPNGRRAIVSRMNPQRGVSEFWSLDLERGTAARMGSGVEEEAYPVWSPGGDRILFAWDREGPFDLVGRRLDGGGADEVLLQSGFDKIPQDWSRDGRLILYRDSDPKASGLGVLRVGSREAPLHVSGLEQANNLRLSPNGRWLLWASPESGRREVYLQRFPEGTGRQQVSVNGGTSPLWTNDGREIDFVSPDEKLMTAAFDSHGDSPHLSVPTVLFAVSRVQLEDAYIGTTARTWDVAPDGRRYLLALPVSDRDPSAITVILNWTAQLAR